MKLIIEIDDEMVCNDIKYRGLDAESATDEVIINALCITVYPMRKDRKASGFLLVRDYLMKTEFI